MKPDELANARVHAWLANALDAAAGRMSSSRLQVNSAALWWFLNKLTPSQRAKILGAYTKALAMAGDGPEEPDAPTKRKKPRG